MKNKMTKTEELFLLQKVINDFEYVERNYHFEATVYIQKKKIKLTAFSGALKADIEDDDEEEENKTMEKSLLGKNKCIPYNKIVAKAIGLEEALVLGQICSIYNDKEFYFTYAEIQEETCLTEYAVRKAIQNLVKLGILTVTRKGVPCRSWYSIKENVIINLLESRNHKDSSSENK